MFFEVLARLAFIDKKIVSGKPSAERQAALAAKKEERLKKRAENRINRAQKREKQVSLFFSTSFFPKHFSRAKGKFHQSY